jgi:hypothetical protein
MERAPTAPLDSVALGLAPKGSAAGMLQPSGKTRRRAAGGVRVEQLREYPVRTLVFEAGDSLAEVGFMRLRGCWARVQPAQHGVASLRAEAARPLLVLAPSSHRRWLSWSVLRASA